MTTEDVVAVVRVMVRALVDSGVRLTADEIAATQLGVALRTWPLLDAAAREQLAAENWDRLITQGRAITLTDGSIWTGDDHADGG